MDNTAKIKALCDWGIYRLPPTPSGKQSYAYEVGDSVRATGKGPRVAGIAGTVADRYRENGYCYYRVRWQGSKGKPTIERHKDITSA
jgi:hypothetical protein